VEKAFFQGAKGNARTSNKNNKLHFAIIRKIYTYIHTSGRGPHTHVFFLVESVWKIVIKYEPQKQQQNEKNERKFRNIACAILSFK